MVVGAEHEGLTELFRRRLDLVFTLLGATDARRLLEDLDLGQSSFEVMDSKLSELVPTEYAADLVVALKRGDNASLGLVIEIQRSRELQKRYAWPYYVAALRARLRCPVVLVVVTPNKAMEGWCRAEISLGHPGFALKPVVLGPSNVPLIQSAEEASSPEMAVLSAVAHGAEDGGLRAALVAFELISGLDGEVVAIYHDLVMRALSATFIKELEAMVASGKYVPQSEFGKKHFEQGEASGRLKECKALVLKLLRVKFGEAVTADVEARVEATALERLEVYAERIVTAKTLEAVFEDG